ncbi:MAG: hypothetical protein MUE72_12325, partial [Chitinophagaceae bacterium]|nr:hypothetical protein [Chitinophagaceae bacterium]
MKKLLNILLLLFYCSGLIAQNDTTVAYTDSAALYLTGAFKQYNPSKMMQTLINQSYSFSKPCSTDLPSH